MGLDMGTGTAARYIAEHPDEFAKDYQNTMNNFRDFVSKSVIDDWQMIESDRDIPVSDLNLSFTDYARAKAASLSFRAFKYKKQFEDRSLYTNEDQDGYAVRIHTDPLVFEVVGFDFEYYRKMSDEDIKNMEAVQRDKSSRASDNIDVGFDLNYTNSRAKKAAYLYLIRDLIKL